MMRTRHWQTAILRNAPDGGGGGGSGGGDGGQAAAATGVQQPGTMTQQPTQQQPAAGEWSFPSNLPDTFKADTPAGVLEKLAPDWLQKREAVSKFSAPKTVDEYRFDPSDKVKPFVGDIAKDPIYGVFRDAALKGGMSAQQFSTTMSTFYEAAVEKGLLPKPYDAAGERAAWLGDKAGGMSPEQQAAEMKPVLDGLDAFVQSLVNKQVIAKDDAAVLDPLFDTAAGWRVLSALQKQFATPGLSPGGQGGPTGLSVADLKARDNDPRNDPMHASFDRAFATETQELWKRMYPG